MSRNDVHSPKNLVTEDYDFFGTVDYGGDEESFGETARIRHEMVTRLLDLGHRFAGVHEMAQCDHCGARLRYAAWLIHRPSGKVIEVGETCLENRFDRATVEFQMLRKQAQLDRERHRIRKAVADFVLANPALGFMGFRKAEDRFEATPEASKDNSFLADLGRKLNVYGSLSERQIEAAVKAVARDAERAIRKVQQDAEQALAGPVPTGRVQIEGVVVGRKTVESYFGYSPQFTTKITVKLDNGSRVFVTEPASIVTERGDRVRMTATITVSDDDASFGFGSRPSKAENLTNNNREEEEI